MADEIKKWTKFLLMGGVLLAIGAPIVSAFGMTLSWAGWVVAAIGLLTGLTIKPSEKLLVSALVLSLVSVTAATQIPVIGGFLQDVLKNVAWLFGGLAIVPAIVTVLKLSGIMKGKK